MISKGTVLTVAAWVMVSIRPINSSKSAFSVYHDYRKEMSIRLVWNSSYKDRRFLGINWFVNYKKKNRSNQLNPEKEGEGYDPLVRLAAVTTDGVYVKKFDKVWFKISQKVQKNREMWPVLSAVDHNPLTAYTMNDNQTTMVVAFKNLTILTLNLSQPKTTKEFILRRIEPYYEHPEGDEEIRSIAQVPYTNLILFSPSRFDFFKVDRMNGEQLHRKRSPLDAVRHIVTPVPTHRAQDDPHNPKKRRDLTLNPLIRKKTELTYFVATGYKINTNALIDWATMKVINYWTLLDREDRVREKNLIFDVRSICFYGGSPRGQLYVMLGSNVIRDLYFFTSSNRNLLDGLRLPKTSSKVQVTWINGTFYVYILQEGITDSPNYQIGSYFLNLGPFAEAAPRFIQKYTWSLQVGVKFEYAKLMTFSMDLTDSRVYNKVFDRLSNFYFLLYKNENSLEVRVPPFNWDICRQRSFNPNLMDFKMFYGGYRHCGGDSCLTGFTKRTGLDHEKDGIYIDCQLLECKQGEILHAYEVNTTVSGTFCSERQEVRERERALSNDNGCRAGFNLDNFGICRRCKMIGIPSRYYPSDCLLWIGFYGLFLEDTSTYNYLDYSVDKYSKVVVYKGMTGEEKLYDQLFLSPQRKGFINDFTAFSFKIIIRTAGAPKLLKQCYFLMQDVGESPKYSLLPAEGFYLDLIENDPTGQAETQRGLYGDNTPLNTFYCRKSCPQGYFYDFNSISCRRCGYGCSECKKFEECDSCVPGLNIYTEPKYKIHPHNNAAIKQCRVGCQEGFYTKSFKGTCHECDQDCEECVDSLFALKEKFVNGSTPESYCLRCWQPQSPQNPRIYVNLSTGVCQDQCPNGARSKEAALVGKKKSIYCYICKTHCLDCQLPYTEICLQCEKSFIVDENGACIKWYRARRFMIWILTGITTAILIFLLGLIFIMYKFLTGCRQKDSRKAFGEVRRRMLMVRSRSVMVVQPRIQDGSEFQRREKKAKTAFVSQSYTKSLFAIPFGFFLFLR